MGLGTALPCVPIHFTLAYTEESMASVEELTLCHEGRPQTYYSQHQISRYGGKYHAPPSWSKVPEETPCATADYAFIAPDLCAAEQPWPQSSGLQNLGHNPATDKMWMIWGSVWLMCGLECNRALLLLAVYCSPLEDFITDHGVFYHQIRRSHSFLLLRLKRSDA